jgi:hypothetical protein
MNLLFFAPCMILNVQCKDAIEAGCEEEVGETPLATGILEATSVKASKHRSNQNQQHVETRLEQNRV